jgi:hypothetical protein
MPELTKEERQQAERDLKLLDNDLKKLNDHRASLVERLGIAGGVEEQHKEAATDAEAFVALGSVGQGQLAREDPERFAKLAAAYREQGEKKLFSRPLVP